MQRETARLTLRESRVRVALAIVTPPLLLLLALGSWAVEAPLALTAILAGLTALLGYVVAFDFPLAIEIDGEGIHHACLLRRRLSRWDDITAIVQPRKRGLVLVTNDRKRRILLDRALDEPELDQLRTVARSREIDFDL
ncbi:MAG: hypothetical protein ACRDZM_07825 [Acidimicrobiia bacterium]